MKGYKVFNHDWKCMDFQYKVGETFRHDGEIEVCKEGFHFCEKIADCFSYYKFDVNNKVAEIEAVGNVKTDGDKSVTDEIKIVREINWNEVLELVNVGENCTGFKNTGGHNSGNCNSGYRNSGNLNSGDFNSGYCNSGNLNSGDCNSGNRNSGDWNKCDFSSGYFNTVSQPVYAFNKPLNVSRSEFISCAGMRILSEKFQNNTWISEERMTDEEKENHPEYECTGGYLKTVDFETACKIMWENLSTAEKQAVCEIPDFDREIFREITGIDVSERSF